jgi:hypothetical protein
LAPVAAAIYGVRQATFDHREAGFGAFLSDPTLDGVTLNCDLHVANPIARPQRLTVTDGLTLNGTMFLGDTSGIPNPGTVNLRGTQELDGTGSIFFVDVNSPFGNNSLTITTDNTTVTLGPGLAVHSKNGVLESQFPTGGCAAGPARGLDGTTRFPADSLIAGPPAHWSCLVSSRTRTVVDKLAEDGLFPHG